MKVKKIKLIVAIIFMIGILAIMKSNVYASETYWGDWTYELNSNTEEVKITSYNGTDSSVSIPNTINGYPVTSISSWAFEDCTGITTLTIPTNVEEIGNYAFYGCNFTKVVFASDCKITEFKGFSGMSKLTSINIPNNVTTICGSALANCTSLKSITIPSKVTKIESWAFEDCTALTQVIMNKNVSDIGTYAFYGCESSTILYCYSNTYAYSYAKAQGLGYKRVDNVEDYTISGISNKTYTGKNITFNITVKQRNVTLKSGTDYRIAYYQNKNTGKASVIITGIGNYSGKVIKYFYIKPKQATGLKVSSQTTTSIKLKWSKNSESVTGYKIYQYDPSSDEYKCIAKTSSTSYTVKNLKSGTSYKFKIRAYKIIDSKTYYGSYSSVVKTATKPSSSKITSLTTNNKKAYLKWKKVSGSSGYEIYMSTSKNGKYTKVKTITSGSTLKYTKSNLKKNKKYYFKIRAYKTVNGKKIYGSYSSVKSIKIQ